MIQCGILYLNYPLFQEYPYKFLFRYVFTTSISYPKIIYKIKVLML